MNSAKMHRNLSAHSSWLHIDQVSAGRQCDKKNAASAGDAQCVGLTDARHLQAQDIKK